MKYEIVNNIIHKIEMYINVNNSTFVLIMHNKFKVIFGGTLFSSCIITTTIHYYKKFQNHNIIEESIYFSLSSCLFL